MNIDMTVIINISVDGPTNHTNKPVTTERSSVEFAVRMLQWSRRDSGAAVTVAHQQNNVSILRPKQCIIWHSDVTCVIAEQCEVEISCEVRKEGELGMWLCTGIGSGYGGSDR
jgi:hypothetical protein